MSTNSSMSGAGYAPANNNKNTTNYTIPCYLPFTPGGLLYDKKKKNKDDVYHLVSISDPNAVIRNAMGADRELNRMIKRGDRNGALKYPSLSNLAQGVFGSLTGVSASNVRLWADSMIVAAIPRSQQQQMIGKANSSKDILSLLSNLPKVTNTGQRPCGYIFRRGDIAWNCRTCQTDGTCVICDECFRNSNHDGHDVTFHRTSPGGCCDCGDIEAWKIDGCCAKHRPKIDTAVDNDMNMDDNSVDDVMEAVKASRKARVEGEDAVKALPEELRAVLGVVIGAAIQCIVDAVDGAAIGADSDQWWIRWREQVYSIQNDIGRFEDWYYANESFNPKDIMSMKDIGVLPRGFRLHLRLHNDDVHTFDEVIDALHEPIPIHTMPDDNDTNEEVSATSTENGMQSRLVPLKEDADDMTHHVDSDGQVTVRSYSTFTEALFGYKRLKSRGLQCSVVSTAQFDLEMRAKVLLNWLRDMAGIHPAISALVVHGLCDVTNGKDACGDVGVWLHPRSIPLWAGMNTSKRDVRYSTFPPHLDSSYLTRDEARTLFKLAKKHKSIQLYNKGIHR